MQDSVMTFSSVTCLSHRQYSVNSKLFAVYELILECMAYVRLTMNRLRNQPEGGDIGERKNSS